MKLSQRYCQHCGHRALTGATRGRRMRSGHVFRKNHDLCARCFRSAKEATIARWVLAGGRIGPKRAPGRVTRESEAA